LDNAKYTASSAVQGACETYRSQAINPAAAPKHRML
jgi:hypothetical protein